MMASMNEADWWGYFWTGWDEAFDERLFGLDPSRLGTDSDPRGHQLRPGGGHRRRGQSGASANAIMAR